MDCRLRLESRGPILDVGDEGLDFLAVSVGPLQPALAVSDKSRIGCIYGTADFDPLGLANPCWREDGHHDDSGLIAEAQRWLDARDDGLLIVRLNADSPPWWDARNPRELMTYADGSTRRVLRGSVKDQTPSLYSRHWRRDLMRGVADFVARWERGPFGSKTLGYVVSFGVLGTWTRHGCLEGLLTDYQADGPECLAPRPGGAPCVLPDAMARERVSPVGFRDPRRDAAATCFDRRLAELTAQAIIEVARSVKRACGDRKLFGAPCGDILNLAAVQDGIPRSGALAMGSVLRSPAVDFLIAPADCHDPAGPVSCAAAFASAHRHGKAVVLSTGDPGVSTWPPPRTAPGRLDDLSAYARDRGFGLWIEQTTDLGSWDPLLHFHARTRGVPARTAFVIDDEGLYHLRREKSQIRQLISEQLAALRRVPLAVDLLFRSELQLDRPYDLVVFPDAFQTTPERIARVHGCLEAWRATALWLVAPGFVQDDVAFENAERITGIAIRKPDRDHRTWVRSTARLGKLEFGSATVQAHTPIVVDTDAEALAHYVDDGHVALARRKMGAWTSIYSAVPILHPELLGLLLA